MLEVDSSSMTRRANILPLLVLKYLRDLPGPASGKEIVTRFCGSPEFMTDLPTALINAAEPDGGKHNSSTTAWKFAYVEVRAALHRLSTANLIQGLDSIRSSDDILAKSISISPSFHEIQSLIGFSLTDSMNRRATTLTPIFGRPTRSAECDIFVIMPFDPNMAEIYSLIKTSGEWLGQRVRRADEIFGASKEIMQLIWEQICTAKVILADITGRNPNVFYELGIAHTVGRAHVILLTRDDQVVPFDLSPLQVMTYTELEVTRDKGYRFAEKITHRFAQTLGIGVKSTGRDVEQA